MLGFVSEYLKNLPRLYHTFGICDAQAFLCLSQGSTPVNEKRINCFWKRLHLESFDSLLKPSSCRETTHEIFFHPGVLSRSSGTASAITCIVICVPAFLKCTWTWQLCHCVVNIEHNELCIWISIKFWAPYCMNLTELTTLTSIPAKVPSWEVT